MRARCLEAVESTSRSALVQPVVSWTVGVNGEMGGIDPGWFLDTLNLFRRKADGARATNADLLPWRLVLGIRDA